MTINTTPASRRHLFGGGNFGQGRGAPASIEMSLANAVQKSSAIHTVAPFGANKAGWGGGPYTFINLFSAETDFYAFRIVLQNLDPTAPMIVGGVKAAVTSQVAGIGKPVLDSNGTLSPYVDVTFGGATTGISVPTAPGDSSASLLVSDWVYLKSIPRTDGGAFPLVTVQVLSPASGTSGGGIAGPVTSSDALDWTLAMGGRTVLSAYTQNGPNAGFGGYFDDNYPLFNFGSFMVQRGVQFLSVKAGHTLLNPGDSLWRGFSASPANYKACGAYAAAALSSSQVPVGYAAAAWDGQTTTHFLLNGKTMFDAINPTLVVIPCGSPNGTDKLPSGTQAQRLNAELAEAMAFREYCLSKGALAFLATAVPWGVPSNYDTASSSAAVRALGVPFIDIERALNGGIIPPPGTQASPLPPYRLPDPVNLHLSDAGYRAMGDEIARAIRPFIY